MTPTPPSRRLDAAIFADRLAVVSMALFVVYLVSVLAVILPFRLLDLLWQMRTIKAASEAASIPLLGLVLLHLAAYLSPDHIPIQKRRAALARLAILASLGFLLFVPLQGHAVWKSYRIANAVSDQQQASASQQANTVRQAIEQATSSEDLKQRLLDLQRRKVLLTLDIERLPAIPLPSLKQQLIAQVNQAQGQYNIRFARLDPVAVEQLIKENARIIASSLAFSIAFAACAQRKNSEFPFLVELPFLIKRMFQRLFTSLLPRPKRAKAGKTGMLHPRSAIRSEEEYFKSLADPQDNERPAP
jgi:hypothetical protein